MFCDIPPSNVCVPQIIIIDIILMMIPVRLLTTMLFMVPFSLQIFYHDRSTKIRSPDLVLLVEMY